MHRIRSRRSPRPLVAVAALALATTTACGGSTADRIARQAPPDVDRFARGYLELIGAGRLDSAAVHFAPSLPPADSVRQVLALIQPILAGHALDTARIIGVRTNVVRNAGNIAPTTHVNLSYEMQVPEGWLVANVASFEMGGMRWVEGFSASLRRQALAAEHGFSLAGKSALHWTVLLLAVVAALVSAGTAVFIATRRGMPRRFAWALLALLGAGSVALDWTSGAVGVKPLNVQLLSAGAVRMAPGAPWIVMVSLPLGALVAAQRYRRWRKGTVPPAPDGPA